MNLNLQVLLALNALLILSTICACSPTRTTSKSAVSKRALSQADFYVNGSSIPGVPFTVTDSYAGLLPISTTDTRQLFFWWYPTVDPSKDEDLVIWLNGGPGCSSLGGMFYGVGPIRMPVDSLTPYPNPYSWNLISNVLFIEQPVGTGFTTGKPDITNEVQLAAEFYSFLLGFYSLFPDLRSKKLWIVGESYAGTYIPYIVDYILLQNAQSNQADLINYKGFNLVSPTLGNDFAEEIWPSVEFAVRNQKAVKLNDSFIELMQSYAKGNGTDNFVAKNLHYPPTGLILAPKEMSPSYNTWSPIYRAMRYANPDCYNVYNILDPCHNKTAYENFDSTVDAFVNKVTGFKEYIHTFNASQQWFRCSQDDVFLGDAGDTSPAPADTKIFQRIIEQSEMSIVQHGNLDFRLLQDGTSMAIQNSTWNGKQGFQKPPTKRLILNGKERGHVQIERGLTFFRTEQVGHKVALDAPDVAFKILQYMLGQIPEDDLYH